MSAFSTVYVVLNYESLCYGDNDDDNCNDENHQNDDD